MRIQDLFKQVVKENANKIAVKTAGLSLTYDGLDKESDRMAAKIVSKHGLEPKPWPIFFNTDLMAAKILAILKAGKIAAVIPEVVPDFGKEIPIYNDGAFLAFTSGSTGSSKAVVYSHKGMIALARTENNAYNFKDDEVIGSYRSGAPLYRTLCDALLNGLTWSCCDGKLDEWIVREKITHLGLTATDFRNLMLSPLKFPSLRWLSVGGEMVDWDDFKWFKETSQFSDDCVFLCRYACSETHTISLLRLSKDHSVGKGRLPVGVLLPGVEIRLVSQGYSGGPRTAYGMYLGDEIEVHSPWLAIEYWQDEPLTRLKFFVDEKDGKRWYLTGDKGYFKDGILHHEGRI